MIFPSFLSTKCNLAKISSRIVSHNMVKKNSPCLQMEMNTENVDNKYSERRHRSIYWAGLRIVHNVNGVKLMNEF